MNKFENFSLKQKIFFGCISILLPILFLTGYLVYQQARIAITDSIDQQLNNTNKTLKNMVETTAKVSIRSFLRAVLESNLDIIKDLYQQTQTGEMSQEQAKAIAKKIVLSQPIGTSGYIYILDGSGTVLVHPNKKLVGINIAEQDFGKRQLLQKNGYLEYDWKNPDEKKARAKALFSGYFAPWNWIVAVSSYRSEFSELVTIDDFRDQVLEVKLGRNGYPFVLDFAGKIIAHPNTAGHIFEEKNKPYAEVLSEMISRHSGRIEYVFKDPLSGTLQDKIAFFDTIKDFDWVIGSAVYVDDYYAPLKRIQYILLGTTLLGILAAILCAILLSSVIARPFRRLLDQVEEGVRQQGLTFIGTQTKGNEVRVIAQQFYDILSSIQRYSEELEVEIVERRNAEDKLKIYYEVFLNAIEGITITDYNSVILVANPAFANITGYTLDEVRGNKPSMLKSEQHDSEFYKELWSSLLQKGAWSGEILNKTKDGKIFPELLNISSIKNQAGEITHFVAFFQDISEIKAQEETIRHMAYHDSLTSLPNRTLFLKNLGKILEQSDKDAAVAVLFIDIDNFKTINDSLGHTAGDKLLILVAERLRTALCKESSLYRLGGDEFIVMVERPLDDQAATTLSLDLMQAMNAPFMINEHELFLTLSMGISIGPRDGSDPETLLQSADLAMYESKDSGRNTFHTFNTEMRERVQSRLGLQSDIRRALANGEFQAYYQPQIRVSDGALTGMEALARWVKPDGSLVSPGVFIPHAEETGMIVELGDQLFDQTCRFTKQLSDAGFNLKLSFNISPRQFQRKNFYDILLTSLLHTGLSPKHLELEITESTFVQNIPLTKTILNNLAGHGIDIAIDDFGTGYSSLAYLKTFPIHTLKIDKIFIDNVLEDDNDATIVESIIDLTKRFKMRTVAEGVENAEQAAFLRNLSCDCIQGFYYSKPLSAEDFRAYCEQFSWQG